MVSKQCYKTSLVTLWGVFPQVRGGAESRNQTTLFSSKRPCSRGEEQTLVRIGDFLEHIVNQLSQRKLYIFECVL